MSYYGNVNPELLDIIPLDAGRVLELGCGEGALAATYRERNPKVHYVAAEMHGAAAAVARARVDRLIAGDFENVADAEVTGGAPFDAIVMGDVLEHFADPERVLARMQGLLADDGHLAISVPNVAHWSALFHLMHGRWPAQDDGLFDRTHLRFFTLASLGDALGKAGFRIVKMKPRQFLLDKDKAAAWIPPLADLAERMGIDRAQFQRRASTLQYVVLAEKSARPSRPRMQVSMAVFSPILMAARTKLPATALASLADVVVAYGERVIDVPRVSPETPKILVIQRMLPLDERQLVDVVVKAMQRDYLVVAELDDHPDLCRQVLVGRGARDPWWSVEIAHAVQTSTEPLAQAMRARNPEVRALPNAALALPPLITRQGGPLTIFYGASNREKFSAKVAAALSPVIADHPQAVFDIVCDRAFFDALPTTRKRFRSGLEYDAYLAALGDSDIALSPLEGQPAELFKSDIKYVEAASRGSVMVASPAVYEATIVDGLTGLIARDVDDWAPAIDRLLRDPELHKGIATRAWADIRDRRMFGPQAVAQRDWYRSLWARRDELNASLRARVPAIDAALRAAP